MAYVHLIVQWTDLFTQLVWHFNKTSQFECCIKNEKHWNAESCRKIFFMSKYILSLLGWITILYQTVLCLRSYCWNKKNRLRLFLAIYKEIYVIYLLFYNPFQNVLQSCLSSEYYLTYQQHDNWQANWMRFRRRNRRQHDQKGQSYLIVVWKLKVIKNESQKACFFFFLFSLQQSYLNPAEHSL